MPVIDFHNHLIPCVDDGAQSLSESEAGVAAFVANGVIGFAATPHIDAGLTLNARELKRRLAEIDAGWEMLAELCAAKFPDMRVMRAAELLLDVPEPDLSDARLRINGGKFFLVEFPYMTVPPHSARVLHRLTNQRYVPILAHPERYRGITSVENVAEWKLAGALLQVNGGSLLGRYGKEAKRIAFELLERGLVDYLCSDYHARGAPLIQEYSGVLHQLGAAEQAHTLMHTNPARLFEGEWPLPVSPVRSGPVSMWQRVGRLFR